MVSTECNSSDKREKTKSDNPILSMLTELPPLAMNLLALFVEYPVFQKMKGIYRKNLDLASQFTAPLLLLRIESSFQVTCHEWMQLKIRDFLKPLFVALSGRSVSLPLFDSMVFLGPDLTRMRLREALKALGVSKKQAKRLEKQHREYRSSLGNEHE